MADFWEVAPRSLVEFGRLFRGACCLQEAVSTSEKSVNFYQRVWRNIPKVTHKTLNSLKILNHDHFHCAQRVAVSNVIKDMSPDTITINRHSCHVKLTQLRDVISVQISSSSR